jgi:hypothetical protein
MEMSDEPTETTEPTEPKAPRKKRSDAGKPRGGSGGGGSRFNRRATKATETVRELVQLRMPNLDVSDLSFGETVERDAEAWGDFLAQVAEWFVPFGAFLDLVFGASLVRVLRMAPSFRAGRRDFQARAAVRAEARVAAYEEAEIAAAIEAEREHAAETGVFAPAPPAGSTPVFISREDWLRNGGGAE